MPWSLSPEINAQRVPPISKVFSDEEQHFSDASDGFLGPSCCAKNAPNPANSTACFFDEAASMSYLTDQTFTNFYQTINFDEVLFRYINREATGDEAERTALFDIWNSMSKPEILEIVHRCRLLINDLKYLKRLANKSAGDAHRYRHLNNVLDGEINKMNFLVHQPAVVPTLLESSTEEDVVGILEERLTESFVHNTSHAEAADLLGFILANYLLSRENKRRFALRLFEFTGTSGSFADTSTCIRILRLVIAHDCALAEQLVLSNCYDCGFTPEVVREMLTAYLRAYPAPLHDDAALAFLCIYLTRNGHSVLNRPYTPEEVSTFKNVFFLCHDARPRIHPGAYCLHDILVGDSREVAQSIEVFKSNFLVFGVLDKFHALKILNVCSPAEFDALLDFFVLNVRSGTFLDAYKLLVLEIYAHSHSDTNLMSKRFITVLNMLYRMNDSLLIEKMLIFIVSNPKLPSATLEAMIEFLAGRAYLHHVGILMHYDNRGGLMKISEKSHGLLRLRLLNIGMQWCMAYFNGSSTLLALVSPASPATIMAGIMGQSGAFAFTKHTSERIAFDFNFLFFAKNFSSYLECLLMLDNGAEHAKRALVHILRSSAFRLYATPQAIAKIVSRLFVHNESLVLLDALFASIKCAGLLRQAQALLLLLGDAAGLRMCMLEKVVACESCMRACVDCVYANSGRLTHYLRYGPYDGTDVLTRFIDELSPEMVLMLHRANGQENKRF